MRISDWSSDVCSSDLGARSEGPCPAAADEQARASSPDGGDGHPSRLARWNGDPGAGVVHARSHRLCGRTPQKHHRSEEHTSELQSLMRISYAVFCLKKKNEINKNPSST